MSGDTRAIVVGIERYAEPAWNIDGPAADACRMARWLTGKGVPAGDITALISPLEHNEDAVRRAGIPVRRADRESVYRLFSEELPDEPAARLFVYWVGHGMTHSGDTLLAFADTCLRRRRYLNLRQLMVWLGTREVDRPNQTILVDSCRVYAEGIGIAEPNCWSFDPGYPAAGLRQEGLLAVPSGEPSIRPPGSYSTRFSAALHAELANVADLDQLDVRSLGRRVGGHEGVRDPIPLIYLTPDGYEPLQPATPGDRGGGPAGTSVVANARTAELASLLGAVQSMRFPQNRAKVARELEFTFETAGMFDHEPWPSVVEIAMATTLMSDWPPALRGLCASRYDLFPRRERAVGGLFAFLDELTGAAGW